MKKLGTWIYNELIAGRTIFDWAFLGLGLFCQILAYICDMKAPIVLITGLAGILSVYLCAQGKISMFAFGIVNVLGYMWISYQQRLYGEVAINMFYFTAQIYGIWNWRRRYRRQSGQSEEGSGHLATRTLSWAVWISLIVLSVAGSLLTGMYLQTYTTDSDPYFDSFTTIPAFVAEILMVMGFREQWYLWFLIDIGCILMWLRAGNLPMAILYGFWCINCIYGFVHWKKLAAK